MRAAAADRQVSSLLAEQDLWPHGAPD